MKPMTDFSHSVVKPWRHGQPARNAWQHLPGTYLSELLASSGADVVTLDLQHGMIDLNAAKNSILAIEARGAAPFARLPGNDAALVCSLLDAGLAGVICPTVESREQAQALVSAACYPPHGARSCGPNRALLSFGGNYVEIAKNTVVTFAMIETVAGLEAVEEIAAIENLTGLFIGPGDLGISMGIGPGQDRNEAEFTAAVEQVAAAARKHGKKLGIHAKTPEYAASMAGQGFDLVTICSDADLLASGAAEAVKRFERVC